ncbi:MAG: methyl-accepting chemotaxis protein, partial [Bacillota bacterium]
MRFTIANKIRLGFGLMILLIGTLAVVAYTSLVQVSSKFTDVTERLDHISIIANGIRADMATEGRTVVGYLSMPGNEGYRLEYEAAVRDVKSAIQTVRPMIRSEEGKALLNKVEALHNAYVQEATPIFQQRSFTAAEVTARVGILAPLRAEAAQAILDLIAVQEEIGDKAQQEAAALTVGAERISIILSVVAALLATGVSLWIIRIVTRPVAQLHHQLKQLAEGHGDLTQRIHVDTRDEIGDLVVTFNSFLSTLQSLLRGVRQSSESVTEATQQLSSISDQLARASQEIASSITEMSSGTEGQVEAVGQSTRTVVELRAAIEQIASGAQSQAQSAQGTA